MKRLLLIFLIPILAACGSVDATQEAPKGIFVDAKTEAFFKTIFDKTKECGGLPNGSFEELSIVLMPPIFPCEFYPVGCSGSFYPPNLINIGNYDLFDHEVIHYLIFKNTGDRDPNHTSPLFEECQLALLFTLAQ